MYSGSITSPRELQAMQGEVEQLRRTSGRSRTVSSS